MVSHPASISQQTFDWFLVGDARAYPQIFEFLLSRGRRLGASVEVEDLAQSLLLDLLRLRERGALPTHTRSELEAYLTESMRRRSISAWRKRARERGGSELVDVADSGAEAPDDVLRGQQHVELCAHLMQHALELAGAGGNTWRVVRRIVDRFALGRDMDALLVDSGLLKASASAAERSAERSNENRRQSRARATLIDALQRLRETTRVSNTPGSFCVDSRKVPFDTGDVDSALRFALSLGRCERAETPTRTAQP